MFYQLIEKRVDEWFAKPDCPMRPVTDYIVSHGMMRDAQVAAIRTFLYLKVACDNRPLWQLFAKGFFNAPSDDYDNMELSVQARETLKGNKAAEALFQYSRMKDRNGRQMSPELEKFIKAHPLETDYEQAFRDIFYGVTYPDYIFSLPMGAGKTYLMAAFIYLDLYLALQSPGNKAFAHNFMILAPSGLKASIVPSLRHIQDFDPTWVMPDPTASQIRRMISFEVLDEQKTASKSNLIKNPNAQKINNHQPLADLWGLVAVTNAEKVILDRIDKDNDPKLYSQKEWQEIKSSNELRDIIARIPSLAIYIDEVHHASDGDIKLRQVVNGWMERDNVNGVLGFSGTPYLRTAEKVTLGGLFDIKNTNLTNVVYDYPLVQGVGNFLKRPSIKTTDNNQEAIITEGVNEFLERFGSTVYPNGTCAKLAIYCSRIENLEETVYPLVSSLVSRHGLNPQTTILRYHGGNKQYPVPAGSAAAFAALDTEMSAYRIILLAQIGKEGWDCKSLTSVILPQKGACPQNMVLQTSCRCLRQVTRGDTEERALIWLNKDNADTLNKELKRQQDTSIDALNRAADNHLKRIDRFVRRNVPPIDFYQLQIHYNTLIIEEENDTAKRLAALDPEHDAPMQAVVTREQDLSGNDVGEDLIYREQDDEDLSTTFRQWLLAICKESMGTLTMLELRSYDSILRRLYAFALRPDIDQKLLRSLIRRCFAPVRTIDVRKETLREGASILKVENLRSPLLVGDDRNFYPDQPTTHRIVASDAGCGPCGRPQPENGTQTPSGEAEQARKSLEQLEKLNIPGAEAMIRELKAKIDARGTNVALKDKTYHYIPYRFDSSFEIEYFSKLLLGAVNNKPLEVYFNGDDTLTDFRIACYSHRGDEWRYIGHYVPDFLMLHRGEDGAIDKVLIIETKGEGFAAKFRERRDFMSRDFVRLNNDKFGYRRFDFLYIEDTMSREEQQVNTLQKINEFFGV